MNTDESNKAVCTAYSVFLMSDWHEIGEDAVSQYETSRYRRKQGVCRSDHIQNEATKCSSAPIPEKSM